MSKKKQSPTDRQRTITTRFGYGLFVAAVTSLTISTIIPWTGLLLQPGIRKLNVVITLLVFVISALLPPVMAYILGDKSTRYSGATRHHFNGVLFSLASFWLSILFGMISSETIQPLRKAFGDIPAMILNAWPLVAIILIMGLVAVYYAHHQHRQDTVLDSKPYQIMLFGSMIATLLYMLASQLFTIATYSVASLLYIILPIAFVAMSYVALRRGQPLRLPYAVIATSIGLCATALAGQFIALWSFDMLASCTIGLWVWASYLLLMRRVSPITR